MKELKLPVAKLPRGWNTVLLYVYYEGTPLYCEVYASDGSCTEINAKGSTLPYAPYSNGNDDAKAIEEINKFYGKETRYGKVVKGFVTNDVYFKNHWVVFDEFRYDVASKLSFSTNASEDAFAKKFLRKSMYDFMMGVKNKNCKIIPNGCAQGEDMEYPYIMNFGANTLSKEEHDKWDELLKSFIIVDIKFMRDNEPFMVVFSKIDDGKKLKEFLWYIHDGHRNIRHLHGMKTKRPAKRTGLNYLENSVRRMF